MLVRVTCRVGILREDVCSVNYQFRRQIRGITETGILHVLFYLIEEVLEERFHVLGITVEVEVE